MLDLTIPGLPLPWKAPYVGSRGAFSPRYAIKKTIQEHLRKTYQGPLIDVAVRVNMFFFMQIPKSASKKLVQKMISGEERPTAGGDYTNLRKFYEDCLQEIVIVNDRQIVEGDGAKLYSFEPRTVILIRPPMPGLSRLASLGE